MKNRTILWAATLLAVGALTACSGGGNNSSDDKPTTQGTVDISGQAFKGPLSGSVIRAFDSTNTLLAETTTDASGNYQLTLDHAFRGVIRIEVSGGQYIDEATGNSTPLSKPIQALKNITSSDEVVHVTPVTELATRSAQANGSQVTPTIVENANERIADAFSLTADIVTTKPVNLLDTNNAGKSGNGVDYSLVIAGMTQVVKNSNETDTIDALIDKLDEDLKDNQQLDDTSQLEDLSEGINDFIQSPNNAAEVKTSQTTLDTAFKQLQPQTTPIVFSSGASLTAMYGDTLLANIATGGNGTGSVTYSSNAPAIVSVDEISGIVTILQTGTATITARKARDTEYSAAYGHYQIDIARAPQDNLGFTVEGNIVKTFGEAPFINAINGGSGSGAVVYASNAPNIASIDTQSGEVTLLRAGSATITATKAGDNNYTTSTHSYQVQVLPAEQNAFIFAMPGQLNKQYGEQAFINTASGGSGSGAISYTSSQPQVASVDPTNGEVTIHGVGTTNVTAVKEPDSGYKATIAQYILTISAAPQIPIAYLNPTMRVTYGAGTVVNPISGGSGIGQIVYQSSDASIVGAINTDGSFTPVSTGTVTITATKSGGLNYLPSQTSFSLTVDKALYNQLAFENSVMNKRFGDTAFINSVLGTNGGSLAFNSDNTDIATIDSSGRINIVSPGSVTISATRAATSQHQAATATFLLNISAGDQADLIFEASVINKTVGDTPFQPALNGGSGNGTITYTSSAPNVATVDPTSGEITFDTVGQTTITATKAADSNFLEQSATLTLIVSHAPQPNFTFASSTISKTYGDPAFSLDITGTLGNGDITFNNDSPSIISIDAQGLVTLLNTGVARISATIAEDTRYASATTSMTLTVNKAAQTPLVFNETAKTLTFSSSGYQNTLSGGSGTGSVMYTSSAPNIATVNASTGEVTVVSAGSTVISAIKATDSHYLPTTATYAVNVTQADQQVLSFTSNAVSKTFGDANFIHALQGGSGSGAITYSSDNANVATVDAVSGQVALIAAGSATITAMKDGDANYLPSQASFALTVGKAPYTQLAFENAVMNKQFGDSIFINTVTGISGVTVTYASSNDNVASIDNSGNITIASTGNATISVTRAATPQYQSATATFLINVTTGDQETLVFEASTINKTFGDTAFKPALTGGSGNGAISFTSSAPDVATIDAISGEITFASAGQTTITATKAADANFSEQSVTLTLNISHAQQSDFQFTNSTISKTYGDSVFSLEVTGALGNGEITFINDTPSIVSVDTQGLVTVLNTGVASIRATIDEDTRYATATAITTVTIDKAAQAPLTFSDAAKTLVFGTTGYRNTLSGGSGTGSLIYTSSSPNIIDVDATTGTVTVNASGTAIVTATKVNDAHYNAATATYAITVTQANQQALAFINSTVRKTFGDATFVNALQGGSGSGTITYTSNDTNVATVDKTSGQVNIMAAGSVTITAHKAADDQYNASTAVFDLVVDKGTQTPLVFTSSQLTKRVDDNVFENAITGGSGTGVLTYRSSNPDIASIDANGNVTVSKSGTVTITAEKATDSNYLSSAATFELQVLKIAQQPLAFAESVINTTYGETPATNTVNGGSGAGTVTYTSSLPGVVSVDSAGQITLQQSGSSIITATKAADDQFEASQASYVINVARGTAPAPIAYATANQTTVYSDQPLALQATNGGTGTGAVTVVSSDSSIAVVNQAASTITLIKAGDVDIIATQAADSLYQASQATYRLTIQKGNQAPLTFEQTAINKAFDADTVNITVIGGSGTGTISYASNDTAVATVSTIGDIDFVAPGKTTIQATKAEDDRYLASAATLTLTVNKAQPTTLAFDTPTLNKIYGDAAFTAALTGRQGIGVVQYTGSDATVASVDETSGEITLQKSGSITVTAAQAEDDFYESQTASFTLNISKATQPDFAFEEDSVDKTFGDTDFTPTLLGHLSNAGLQYVSDDTDVVSVNSTTGLITIQNAGFTEITVTSPANDRYTQATSSFTVVIGKSSQSTLQFTDAGPLTRLASTGSFSNPVQGGNGTGAIVYTSSDPATAAVDPATGLVTILSTGNTTVTAQKQADRNYLAASATYQLTVDDKVVEALYSNAANWNDYVKNDGASYLTASGTTCNGSEAGSFTACIHGGELRRLELPSLSTCSGVTAQDELNAFNWRCDSSNNPISIISTGLKREARLSQLLDFDSVTWKSNTVIVKQNNVEIVRTSPQAWWTNPVVAVDSSGQLDQLSTIYVVTENPAFGVTLTGNKSALVIEPGVVLTVPRYLSKNVLTMADINFGWLEGEVFAEWNNDAIQIKPNVRFGHIRGLSVYGQRLAMQEVHNSRIYDTFVSTDIRSTNGGESGINLWDSSGNLVRSLRMNNGENGGLYLSDSTNNIIDGYTASNNGDYGFRARYSDKNTLLNATIANSERSGVIVDFFAHNTSLLNLSIINSSTLATTPDTGDGRHTPLGLTGLYPNIINVAIVGGASAVQGIHSKALYPQIQNLAVDRVASAFHATQVDNQIMGKFLIGNLTGTPCVLPNVAPIPSAPNPMPGYDANCNSQSPSNFAKTSVGSLLNSFVGKVVTEDSTNTSDSSATVQLPLSGIDLFGFDNTYRHWAPEGEAFDAASQKRWTTGTGRIFDWSLRSTDTKLRDVLTKHLSGNSGNTRTHRWKDNSTSTYLRNAVEVIDDWKGNENGLCESNETCIYTPNIGSYQGHGELISAGSFTNGNTLSGITLLQYSENGR
ncbi:Uncharacterised protein [BD1-7 clade bacterium]|nr:Uncharacterised protein [BD1-7 clade bacterium]